jgi:predicted XRE-type DNA-binding protein
MRNGPRSKSERRKTSTEEPVRIEQGSGNVFADLKLPNPGLALAKAELVQRIRVILAERGLTQAKAAKLLEIDQPKVSALLRGRVEGYSLDRLFRFLNALGQQVEIGVRPIANTDEDAAVVVRVWCPGLMKPPASGSSQ